MNRMTESGILSAGKVKIPLMGRPAITKGLKGKAVQLVEDIILKKRDGEVLSRDEIAAFVDGVADESVSEAQIAAFAMATWFRGMNVDEQMALTISMRDSGSVLNWAEMDGPVLDKHSTGGVGDMVSLLLGPIVAACGGYVPMISGRGLGHTGGTLDKLESIPGLQTTPDVTRFQHLVRENGLAIIGQTAALAPADQRFYAVRDVTATVSSRPLIISSILCKKLAEGLDGLVMDVKYGSGAFMAHNRDADLLAREISAVAVSVGLPCSALVTSMDEPLAWSAGNALEIAETVAYLRGESRHQRLHAVVLEVSAELLRIGGLVKATAEGLERARSVLDSGAAAECFARMVAGQGGPSDLLEHPERHLGQALVVKPVKAESAGFVSAIDTRAAGNVVVMLGGGRRRAADRIDHSVGLSAIRGVAEPVGKDEPLALIHASSESDWERAAAHYRSAVRISAERPEPTAVIYSRISEGLDEH